MFLLLSLSTVYPQSFRTELLSSQLNMSLRDRVNDRFKHFLGKPDKKAKAPKAPEKSAEEQAPS